MRAERLGIRAVGRDERSTVHVGGIAAVALGVAYLITMALYATVGAPPLGGEAWLTYAAGKTSAWWAIVDLAILTDLLFVPVAIALFLVLRGVHRSAALLGTVLVVLFAVLDIAVTQTNFAALITLTGDYGAASTAAQRAAVVAAATYAGAALSSAVGLYSIGVLALGEVLLGLVMLRSTFGGSAAYLALAAGILGLISVAGPLVVAAASGAIIASSLLTTAWVLLVGYRLVGLGRSSEVPRSGG